MILPVKYGQQIINESVNYGWNIEYNRKGLPFTICHFHSDTNEDNQIIASSISKGNYSKDQKVSVITFDQQGVKLYERGIVVQEFDKLNQAMQATKDCGKKFVYIMGGKMCSRAFRVASEDWEMYISLMIYGWGDSDASLIVQRMGRMCGLTPKHLICPQRMFATKKTFYKAIDCTNATSELVKTVHENPKGEFGIVKKSVVIGQRKTNVKLSKTGVEKNFAVDNNKENIHGDTKEWNDTEEPEHEENEEDSLGENENEKEYESTTEQLQTVKKAYVRGNSKICKIIDAFMREDFTAFSQKKLTLVCDKFNSTDFTSWDLGRHARYNILQKTPSGKFFLRNEIVEYLELLH